MQKENIKDLIAPVAGLLIALNCVMLMVRVNTLENEVSRQENEIHNLSREMKEFKNGSGNKK